MNQHSLNITREYFSYLVQPLHCHYCTYYSHANKHNIWIIKECVSVCVCMYMSERAHEPNGSGCHLWESGHTCLKVTGASEARRGERLAGDRLHLVTMETGRRHDNGSVGLVEDAQQQWGLRVRVGKWCGWEREKRGGGGKWGGEGRNESHICVCFVNSTLCRDAHTYGCIQWLKYKTCKNKQYGGVLLTFRQAIQMLVWN